MANGPAVGTAYLRVAGDFSQVNSQAVALFSSSRWSKMGKAAGVALAGGLAAAGALKAAYNIGETYAQAFDKIRVGTGETGKELGKLERTFKGVAKRTPADLDSVATAIAGLNQRLDLTGKPLRGLSRQFLELSRITETDVEGNIQSVTRAFGDWEVKTRKQTRQLDFFYRASQESGAGIQDLAQQVVSFGAPLRQVGFSLDEAIAMFAQFEKAGVNTQTMMPGLKFALKSFLAEDLDPQKALQETFEGIESGVISTSEALGIFGQRAGADMVEAIKQGRFELEDFTKTIAEGDDTVGKAAEETYGFAEAWQEVKNLFVVTLAPSFDKFFNGVGDAVKELTRVFRKEGLAGVGQHLADRMGKALDRLTVLVAKKAPGMAKALVEGFLNANAWTRLLVAGVLLKKLGGGAAFTALGKKLGGKMGAGIAIGLVVFGPELIKAYKDWVDKNAPAWREAGKAMGQWFVNGLIDIVNVGIRGINDAMDKANILGNLGVDAPNIGEIGKVDFTDAVKKATAATKVIEKAPSNKQWEKWSKERGGIVKRGSDAVTEIETEGFTERGSKEGRAIRRTLEKFDDKRRKLDRITASEADTVIGNTDSMVGGVSRGLQRFEGNVNKALRALKVKELRFGITGSGHTNAGRAGSTTDYTRGGPIDQGAPSGDSVPAMLERGEYVLNRKAVSALGKQQLDALNFGAFSRFQVGGGVGGLQAGIARLAKFASERYGLTVSSGLRSGPAGASWHNTGEAVDLVPPGMAATQGIFAAFRNQLEELFYDPWGGYDSGQRIGAIGGHLDHIHAAILGGGGPAAMVKKLKRMVLTGPDGPLKDMGQSALDKGWKAANRFLMKQAPSHGNLGAAAGALSDAEFLSLARRAIEITGASGFSPEGLRILAMAESSLIPSSINNWDINAKAGNPSGGLMHLTRSNMKAYAEKGLGSNMFNPLASIAASINYQIARYGGQVTHSPYQWGGMVMPPFGGSFGGGGTIPGPVGVPRTIIGHGGEKVGDPNVEINFYGDGAALLDDVEVLIDGKKAEFAEHTLREGGRHRSQARALTGSR